MCLCRTHWEISRSHGSAIIAAIKQGLDDRVDPSEVTRQIDKLKADLAANDAAADAKLRAKFGGEF